MTLPDQGAGIRSGKKVTHMRSKSLIITKRKRSTVQRMPPVHPGDVLLEEFLKPLSLSQYGTGEGVECSRATHQ